MDCKDLHFSRHAFERMFQRGIDPNAVAQVVASGEIIADYPDDQPFPSALLLGFHGGSRFMQSSHAIRQPVTATWFRFIGLIP